MVNVIYSYWLIPAVADAVPFHAVISALAALQPGAAVFQPHMSLGSLTKPVKRPEPLMESLRDLQLQPTQVVSTEVFTKALFVRFEQSATLKMARQMAEDLPGFLTRRVFDPHISLCYGPPPLGAAQRLDVTDLLNKPVRFAALAEMEISLPVDSYAAVRAWGEVRRWGI